MSGVDVLKCEWNRRLSNIRDKQSSPFGNVSGVDAPRILDIDSLLHFKM